MLAMSYHNGEGVGKSFSEAFRLYLLGAKRSHSDSQYGLGNCYEKGHGVDMNLDEAAKWYKLAADQGHVDAFEALQKLQRAVPPSQPLLPQDFK